MLPDREIHVVDSMGASMAESILCFMGQELADGGPAGGRDRRRSCRDRANDLRMYVSLETLEYLKKGGRISGAQAAIGTLLSVKPIIAVEDGKVETADKPRTRSKSRERCIELITARPIERIAILHTMAPDVDAFRDEVDPAGRPRSRRRVGLDRRAVGRPASRARAASGRRCSTSADRPRTRDADSGPVSDRDVGCEFGSADVALRWMHEDPPGSPGYTRSRHLTRRSPDDASGAPWGRPGDDPHPRAGRSGPASTEVHLTP